MRTVFDDGSACELFCREKGKWRPTAQWEAEILNLQSNLSLNLPPVHYREFPPPQDFGEDGDYFVETSEEPNKPFKVYYKLEVW